MNKKPYEEPRMEDLDTAFLQSYKGGEGSYDDNGDGGGPVDEGDF